MTQAAAPEAPTEPARPVQRYVVRPLSGPLHWGIFDQHMGAWCTLDDRRCCTPLEWKTAEEAEAWLYLCRVAWGNGLVAPPEGWYGR